MRLFIAIDLPDWVAARLSELQDHGLDIRWTTPETMHLTLRFVGDMEDTAEREQLIENLYEIRVPAFEMSINELGYFPPRKHPKIIWAGIQENRTLLNLQEMVEQACRTAGVEPEDRTFIPHVTIGRVGGESRKEVHSFFNRNKKIQIEGIPVDKFILYQSKLRPEGAQHIPVEYFALRNNDEA
ncbi:RNA 2',3'-cyclic phosphodiesterase [Halalkalibaculum sp. DA3122]|uniref:RNA 2',3'-cyclic phosphodiesterase n=1 Tax=Halalkalibaculum sp. DA3122 TaxID=3373607 RepID=UPI00375528E9